MREEEFYQELLDSINNHLSIANKFALNAKEDAKKVEIDNPEQLGTLCINVRSLTSKYQAIAEKIERLYRHAELERAKSEKTSNS